MPTALELRAALYWAFSRLAPFDLNTFGRSEEMLTVVSAHEELSRKLFV